MNHRNMILIGRSKRSVFWYSQTQFILSTLDAAVSPETELNPIITK